MRQIIMHGRRGPTRCNVSRGRITWCLDHTLPSARQSLWNLYIRNILIGFDNSHSIGKPVVYRGVILLPLLHRADVETKVWFLSRPRRDHWVGSRDESKYLKLSFSVEVWDNILTYTLDPSWVIIAPWQICHPNTDACRQFQLQIMA